MTRARKCPHSLRSAQGSPPRQPIPPAESTAAMRWIQGPMLLSSVYRDMQSYPSSGCVWIIIDIMRRPCQCQMVAGLGMAKVRLSLQTLSRPQHVVAGTVRYSAVLYSTAGHLWHSADALYSSSTVLYCTHTMYCIWAHEVQGLDPNCR